jgi:DNA helicase-2/ATP-dependent DNA helicase PcrA
VPSGARADAERDASGQDESITAFVADAGPTERARIANAVAGNSVSPGRAAVLMPDDEQVSAVASACAERGVPVHVPGQPWHGNETLQDVLAYLFVIANPHDDVRLFRIINTPSRGIGRTTQARLRTFAAEHGLSAWEAIAAADEQKALTSRARRVLRGFRDVVEPLVERSEEATPAALTRALVADTELLTSVTRGQTREQIEREERVERFIQQMPEAEGRAALLRVLDDAALGHFGSEPGERVVVATPETAFDVHGSVVFVGGLNEGMWPAEHTVRSDALLQNERRRLAVAVARAQEQAVLSCARSRGTGRREEPAARSRFWGEIEQHRGELPDADLGRDAPREDGRDYRTSLRAKQSDATAAPRPTDDEAAAIRPGQRVEHPKLGRGTVRDVEDDGTTRVAEVDFDGRGTKRLDLKYAPLTEV